MSFEGRSMYVPRSRRKVGFAPGPGSALQAKGLGDAPQNTSLNAVAEALRHLTALAKRQRKTLAAGAREDLLTVERAVAILRGSDHYERLKQMIIGAFPDRPYDLGTVGAYFVNCLGSARDACSAPCVGNLVLEDGVEDVCPTRVFALKFEGSATRSLLALNEAPESDSAIVYIYLDPSRRLGGLTGGEIESLVNLGVREVDVYYYDPQTYEQSPITGGFVSPASLMPVPSYRSEDNSGFWLAIFIVGLILVVAFIMMQTSKKAK